MAKTFDQGKAEIVRLCKYFVTNREAFLAPGVKEAHVRQTLIDPFLEALGWDVRNAAMAAPQYREVVTEDSLDVEGHQKAPDYAFRVGTLTKFFAEAKKCGTNINMDPYPAYQLRRYGWSAKVALSILTDFEELGLYDCTIKPIASEKASHARIQYYRCEEYPDRWRELWNVFSRDAVWSGSFDQYAQSKRKRGTSEVDVEFLKEIDGWREELARNLALRNPDVSPDDLNAAVQRTIDRIVFLRMAEDRGLEAYGQLLKLCERPDIYSRFMSDCCGKADQKYNSGLFHFQKEKGVTEPPDTITPKLVIDDRVFKNVLRSLYFENGSPYHFGVLPVEILGTVYERFLGKVIRLTSGHQAKIEDKPEVRKAGGVYYTPAYIVDYVVARTVGRQIAGRSPGQLAGQKGKPPFRILDMACGSGSFLLGAYKQLLDHCLAWYIGHNPAKNKAVFKDPRKGYWRLSIDEKKRILIAHIFGVDIDPQAVEVSKLSLLLKVLEGETDESLRLGLLPFDDRALPNLSDNIKCGNSLIGPDYFAETLLPAADEIQRINAFSWEKGFPAAMESGGFDCIIGNPPWGATLEDVDLEYFRRRHKRVIARMIDSYIYFTDKATTLAKKGCPIGYVLPGTILNQVDILPLRDLLLERGIGAVINLGQGVFGKKVLNTTSILISCKAEESLLTADLSTDPLEERPRLLVSVPEYPYKRWLSVVTSDPHHTFFVGNLSGASLLQRLRRRFKPLSAAILGTVQRGVSPDIVEAHVVSKDQAKRLGLEKDLLRPSLSGEQIKRYQPWESDQLILYSTKQTDIEAHPNARAFLESFRSQNTCMEVKNKQHPWWALHRARDDSIFASPKIIGLTTTKSIELVFDESSNLFVTDAMYVFSPNPGVNPKALMGVMQSEAFAFLYRVANMGEARVIPQIKASKLLTLPVPNLQDDVEIAKMVEKMFTLHELHQRANSEEQRKILDRQIEETDAAINRVVFDLYGLSAEEILLVGTDRARLKELRS